jgi:hypothetical protein
MGGECARDVRIPATSRQVYLEVIETRESCLNLVTCDFRRMQSKIAYMGERSSQFLSKPRELQHFRVEMNRTVRFLKNMGGEGIEPPTQRASVVCSPTELPTREISRKRMVLNVFSWEFITHLTWVMMAC